MSAAPKSAPSVSYIDLPKISSQAAAPSGLDIDQGLQLVFVACQLDPGYVYVIDATKNSLIPSSPVKVGPYPHGVAVNSSTHLAFVANTGTSQTSQTNAGSGNNTVSVIGLDGDGETWVELAHFPSEDDPTCDPHGVAVDEGLNYLYVANQGSNDVTVFDCSPLPENPPNRINTISVQNPKSPQGTVANPHGIGVDPNLHQVYVACRDANEVAVINESTGAVNFLATGKQPTGIGVDSASGNFYVSNNQDNTVSVFNGVSLKLVATVGSGLNGPDRFAVDEGNHVVYAGNNPAKPPKTPIPSTVTAIFPTDPIVTENISVTGDAPAPGVSSPTEMAYLTHNSTVYVALQAANQVAYFPGLSQP
jgi:DNA-binding beta-propeller fold protein YncE